MNSESTLIEQSLAGDSDAFGGLVQEYQSLVCAVTYSLCGDVARSQEIAQETFISAWRDLATLKDRSKFKSWLCGIARNLARNAYRAESRKATGHTDPLAAADALPSPELEPDDQAMAENSPLAGYPLLKKRIQKPRAIGSLRAVCSRMLNP